VRLLPAERWRRNQHVTVAAVFAVFTGFAFVIPFLPLYVRQLGVRAPEDVALWAGVLIGVAPLAAGLLAPVWGRLADRHGHKAIALKALLAYVLLLVLSAAVTSVGQLFLLRLGVGLFGGIGPLGLAMAAAHAPREETGRAVGAVQAAQILSAAVGPLLGGVLADTIGIRRTFLVTALLCAAALWLVARHYEDGPTAPAADGTASAPWRDLLRLRGVLPLLAVLFLVNFIGRSFTPVLPLHLHELGVPPSRLALSTGILISVYSVAAALSAAWLGRVAGRVPPLLLLGLGLLGGGVSVLPMAWAGGLPSFLGLALALGLASGGCLTLCYTIGSLIVPADRRATAFGFFAGAALFGGAVSPAVAGLLARWDLRAIYAVDAALFGLLAVAALARATVRGRASRGAPAQAEASSPPERA
jgi:DHA1 family multidrug resistance protein-like MFS transporter